MKKTLSLLLSFILLVSSVTGIGITAEAATTENKTLSYKYEYETKTLYVTGKGEIPHNYLGWSFDQECDYQDKIWHYKVENDYKIYWIYGEDSGYFKNDYTEQDIFYEKVYPDYYMDITRHVKNLVIGEGITTIGADAFGCAFPQLEKVTLPGTLKSIDCEAFSACTKLKSIVIPANTELVNEYAFIGCTGLESVVFLGKLTKISDRVNEDQYIPDKNSDFCAGSKNVTIYGLQDSEIVKYCKKYSVKYQTVSSPKKVSGLKASTTGDSVKLNWTAVKGATKYQVQRYVTSQKAWKTVATVTKNTCTVKNLGSSTSYKFRVRAVKTVQGGDFNGSYSNTLTTKTKLGKVSGVKLSAKNGKLTVKWSKTKNAKDYQIYYATSKNGTYKRLTTTSKTSYTKKLTKGKTYYIKVRARQKGSNGKYTYGAFSAVQSKKV